MLGEADGSLDGPELGAALGTLLGEADGLLDGSELGVALGTLVRPFVRGDLALVTRDAVVHALVAVVARRTAATLRLGARSASWRGEGSR